MTQRQALPEASLKQLFTEARTVNGFQNAPISDATLRALYDLLKWGPTAFNAQPARYVFVRSAEAKEKLKPALSSGNVAQTLAASVTVIAVGADIEPLRTAERLSSRHETAAAFVGNVLRIFLPSRLE